MQLYQEKCKNHEYACRTPKSGISWILYGIDVYMYTKQLASVGHDALQALPSAGSNCSDTTKNILIQFTL